MIIQQEIYQISHIMKNSINLLVLIYQEKKNKSVPQQIDLTGKLEEDDGAITFFIGKNSKNLF